jgi:FtsP/CotA-like multicopper oxidase with cupredoxin domain
MVTALHATHSQLSLLRTHMQPSRRQFLLTSLAAASVLAGCRTSPEPFGTPAAATSRVPVRRLFVDRRSVDVNGRDAVVYGLHQPDGTRGVVLDPGERFLVDLSNQTEETTIVHWHGQTPTPDQDGVGEFGIPLIRPGEQRRYDFIARPGTYWMHSHKGLQHQQMLSAPLIVRTVDDTRSDMQEISVFLEDFTFRDPDDVLGNLVHSDGSSAAPISEAPNAMHGETSPSSLTNAKDPMPAMDMAAQGPAMKMDLNDVEFDAYLANARTLDDPQVIRVERGGRVHLRIINGASSTNFHIDLGQLQGTVVSVDGNAVKPVIGSRFGLAMGQRIDIHVQLPPVTGAWPVMALREGGTQQTGVILATAAAPLSKLASDAPNATGPISFDLEAQLSALEPIAPRPTNANFMMMLGGTMHPYAWTINGKRWENRQVVKISAGQRVDITLHNLTMMSHPMHLHGHTFYVVGLNGKGFSGARRDTVLVPPMAKVLITFNADNPGRWLLHCHNLYHMEAGMMTEVAYV